MAPRPQPARPKRQLAPAGRAKPKPIKEEYWATFSQARTRWRRRGGRIPKRLVIVGDWTASEVRAAWETGHQVLLHETAPPAVREAAQAALEADGTFIWMPWLRDTPARRCPPRNLTKGQVRVLRLVARGLKSAEIADRLGLSVRTVETHRHNILRRTGLAAGTPFLRLALTLFPG